MAHSLQFFSTITILVFCWRLFCCECVIMCFILQCKRPQNSEKRRKREEKTNGTIWSCTRKAISIWWSFTSRTLVSYIVNWIPFHSILFQMFFRLPLPRSIHFVSLAQSFANPFSICRFYLRPWSVHIASLAHIHKCQPLRIKPSLAAIDWRNAVAAMQKEKERKEKTNRASIQICDANTIQCIPATGV